MKLLLKAIKIAALTLIIAGCKKQITSENTQNVQKNESQKKRGLGLIVTPPHEYEKLIKYDLLRTKINARIATCTTVDLTGLLPSPGDQGIQGSCVAWAVAYSAKSYWEGRELGWTLNTNAHLFSPQYIYSQTHVNESAGGGGSQFADALNLVVSQGVSTLDVCSYDPWDDYGFQTQPTQTMRDKAFRFRNSGWTALPYRNSDEIKARLCNNELVMMGIPVHPDFDNLSFTNDTYNDLSGDLRGFHAITIIGYDDNKQAFKFINQWGPWWGLDGYGWISYDLIENHDFENYVMQDAPNPIFGNMWSGVSTAGISTLGYYSGDVNGDGNTDIIHPWSNGGTLALLAHDISGSSPAIVCNNTMFGSGVTNIGFVPADFDGDGKTDFVQGWKNGNYLAFSVFKSNGNSFSPFGTWTMSAGYGTLKLLPLDMDGDGKTDVAQLWNNNGKLGINVFKSTGSSYTSSYATTFNEGSSNIGFIPADFDGDGKTDIIHLWNNNGRLGVIVYKSFGIGYSAAWGTTMSEGSSNVGFASVDFDGDGKMDFIQGWNNGSKMSILAYRSNGSSYASVNNSNTQQAYQNLSLLPIKRSGQSKMGFVQIFNNNNKTSFIRYDVINYL